MALRRCWKILGWIAAVVVAAPVVYTAAAFGVLLWPQRVVAVEGGITLYACDNGVHTDLILPVSAAGVDWRATFTPDGFAGPTEAYDYIGLGWGSRDFYLNTPTWAELDAATAFAALLWDETVIRVDYRPHPGPGETCGSWQVDEAAYLRIAALVRDTLRLSQGRPVRTGRGYGNRDAFYVANGRYTIIDTCNQWTGRALRLGGAPVAPWTPFSFLVLWHLPAVPA
ncbi:MAG TPA: TIGR02117 family protein [Alphaproteobacteria bacterium]|nr:TIGR02117 family protein [Alphaproteobacteria bacterium]